MIRTGGGRAGEQFAVDRPRMTIGRAPQSDVFLDDITVSREHAILERRDDGLHLTDRGEPERHLREPAPGRDRAAGRR